MSVNTALTAALSSRLRAEGLEPDAVVDVVTRAIDEDLAGGVDVTSRSTVPEDARSAAKLVARAPGTVAGLDIALAAFEIAAGAGVVDVQAASVDGQTVAAGDTLARIEGPTRSLLLAERTALNLICHLSGVATATSRWVDAVAGTGVVIRDTRKTTPGLRTLEKYAVRCGGGQNHRLSLSDAALVKDNHVAAAGSMEAAVRQVLATAGPVPIEIEVDTLEQLAVAMECGADLLLLDNMSVDEMSRAVAMAEAHTRATGRPVALEASGGMTLERARQVAETGVDFISVGSITHSAPIVDFALDFAALA